MIMRDVSIITRKLRIYAEHVLADEELGFAEQQVLMCLIATGDTNQEGIARFLDIDKGAVAKSVVKLEEKGYVERAVNPKNKREKLVVATVKANDVFQLMKDEYAVLRERMFAGLDEEQISELKKSLNVVATNMSRETDALA